MIIGKLIKLVFDGDANVLPYNYVVQARAIEGRDLDLPMIVTTTGGLLRQKITEQASHYLKCRNYDPAHFKIVATYESTNDDGEFWAPTKNSSALFNGL